VRAAQPPLFPAREHVKVPVQASLPLARLAERGASIAQVAVLLIAPVVVASTFAVAVLNAGQLATRQFNDAALSAIRDASSGLELRGPVSLRTDGHAVTHVVMDISLTAGSAPVMLDPAATVDGTQVSYIDSGMVVRGVPYQVDWLIGDGDNILGEGETVEMRVDVSGITSSGASFSIEVRPAHGMYLIVRRERPTGNELAPMIELW
jgi:archaellin